MNEITFREEVPIVIGIVITSLLLLYGCQESPAYDLKPSISHTRDGKLKVGTNTAYGEPITVKRDKLAVPELASGIKASASSNNCASKYRTNP